MVRRTKISRTKILCIEQIITFWSSLVQKFIIVNYNSKQTSHLSRRADNFKLAIYILSTRQNLFENKRKYIRTKVVKRNNMFICVLMCNFPRSIFLAKHFQKHYTPVSCIRIYRGIFN